MDKKDQYDLSDGNIKILETIPKMMTEKKYRLQFRVLVIEYIVDKKNEGHPSAKR